MVVIKNSTYFWKCEKFKLRKTQLLPLSKLWVYMERLLSQKQVVRRQLIQKQNTKRNGCHKKLNIFLEIRQIQSQKNRRKTKPLASSKLLIFSTRPLSQQPVARRQFIGKQTYQRQWLS